MIRIRKRDTWGLVAFLCTIWDIGMLLTTDYAASDNVLLVLAIVINAYIIIQWAAANRDERLYFKHDFSFPAFIVFISLVFSIWMGSRYPH